MQLIPDIVQPIESGTVDTVRGRQISSKKDDAASSEVNLLNAIADPRLANKRFTTLRYQKFIYSGSDEEKKELLNTKCYKPSKCHANIWIRYKNGNLFESKNILDRVIKDFVMPTQPPLGRKTMAHEAYLKNTFKTQVMGAEWRRLHLDKEYRDTIKKDCPLLVEFIEERLRNSLYKPATTSNSSATMVSKKVKVSRIDKRTANLLSMIKAKKSIRNRLFLILPELNKMVGDYQASYPTTIQTEEGEPSSTTTPNDDDDDINSAKEQQL